MRQVALGALLASCVLVAGVYLLVDVSHGPAEELSLPRGGARRARHRTQSLVQYSVHSSAPVPNLPSSGFNQITDADQGAAEPAGDEARQKTTDRLFHKLEQTLMMANHEHKAQDDRVRNLQAFIRDSIEDVAMAVKKDNARETDAIAKIEGLRGPPGPPGMGGRDGDDGSDGPNGVPGSKGPDGVIGESGPPGVQGPEGSRGPEGDRGPRGRPGPDGGVGVEGGPGMRGKAGLSDAWEPTGYDCPAAATETMRMVRCNRKGCRLETMFHGEWGTVCDEGFTSKNAEVLCKAMGFRSGGTYNLLFGSGQTAPERMWLKDVSCEGGEGDVADCKHGGWGKVHGCDRHMAVGICCLGIHGGTQGARIAPSDFPLCPKAATPWARLRDCDYKKCRLEVNHDDVWGTVCDRGFTDAAAAVACRSLGFEAGGLARRAGGGKGMVWLSNVQCAGTETNIEWCPRGAWGRADCDHDMDAGVCCLGKHRAVEQKAPGPAHVCAGGSNAADNGSTRLVDCKATGCRLEVKHEDVWGTVCGAGFSRKAAQVVCRSLGLPGGYVVRRMADDDNIGIGKVWLSDVGCAGSESWVGACRHSGWGDNACTHADDVGVCCAATEHFKNCADMRTRGVEVPKCGGGEGPKVRLDALCSHVGPTATLPVGLYPRLSATECDDDGGLCKVEECNLEPATLSSMQIPDGVEVTLYDDFFYAGTSRTFRGPADVGCLVSFGWNDRAKSLKITQI